MFRDMDSPSQVKHLFNAGVRVPAVRKDDVAVVQLHGLQRLLHTQAAVDRRLYGARRDLKQASSAHLEPLYDVLAAQALGCGRAEPALPPEEQLDGAYVVRPLPAQLLQQALVMYSLLLHLV